MTYMSCYQKVHKSLLLSGHGEPLSSPFEHASPSDPAGFVAMERVMSRLSLTEEPPCMPEPSNPFADPDWDFLDSRAASADSGLLLRPSWPLPPCDPSLVALPPCDFLSPLPPTPLQQQSCRFGPPQQLPMNPPPPAGQRPPRDGAAGREPTGHRSAADSGGEGAAQQAASAAANAAAAAAAAELAAAALGAEESQVLHVRLSALRHSAVGLQMRNAELEANLESARSELPAKELAYEQLKESFFQLQQRYAASQHELRESRSDVEQLRARLAAAEAALSSQQEKDSE
ncbi:hypothetical protein N2152v2_000184 [Parachlorella kessleri]